MACENMTLLRTKKILIIEDDLMLASVYKCLLEMAGCRDIRHAESGIDGLEIAKIWRPALIISDILHPGLDGFSIFEELFLHPATLSTRFVIISGCSVRANPEYAERAQEVGVYACLEKPINLRKFLRVVYKVLAEAEEETRIGL